MGSPGDAVRAGADPGRVSTHTFLFTDIEGSTPLWEDHPAAMRTALARHDSILRSAVEAHRGRVFKATGDGLHAVFAEPRDAAAAAADAQRTLAAEPWGETGPLRVRMGIDRGEAELRDEDYFGPALNRAARLMEVAHGGQVVMSADAAEHSRSALPEGADLLDLGAHRLRGLHRSERVYQLAVPGLRLQFPPLQSLEALAARLPLPFTAFGRSDEQLTGREDELEQLERSWRAAAEGTRQALLLTGEPGIGKTRIAAELSRRVHERGALVLYGRCDEEAIVPYQPFVEALRPYIDAAAPSTLNEQLRGLGSELARLFPELAGRFPELTIRAADDPEIERYRLFEAVAGVVNAISRSQPALLVLDDLHWANRATLLLLRHVLRSTPHAALLVLVCYRDVEVTGEDATGDLLGELHREPFVMRLSLRGLSDGEVARLVKDRAGRSVTPSVATALHDATDGNPFFLDELLRHLAETDGWDELVTRDGGALDLDRLGIPEGVTDLVARRLRRLSPRVNEVLALAAVIGPEFEASVLARAAELPVTDVLDALDRATRAGLVHGRGDEVGTSVFSHALVRQAVYRQLGTAARAQHHAKVGRALEEVASSDREQVEALARHFTIAAPLGEAASAIEYTTRAGHRALAEFAFDEAPAHFERALRLIELYQPNETHRHVELLIDFAESLLFVDQTAGERAALRAIDAARDRGTAEQFGRAVMVLCRSVNELRGELVGLFDEVHAALGESQSALRARLMAIEAFKYLTYVLRGRDGRALSSDALRLARTTDDPITLADALFTRAVSLEGSADVTERITLGEELVRVGERVGAGPWGQGLRVLARAHLELGDPDALEADIAELGRIGERFRWLPASAFAAQWRATRALIGGQFDDFGRFGEEMLEYARAYHGMAGIHAVQRFYFDRERGEIGDLERMVQFTQMNRENVPVRAMLSIAQLDAGHVDQARRTLDELGADGFRRAATESGSPSTLAFLAEVATACGTTEQRTQLAELLTPFRERLVVALLGLGCLGAADRHLAMLSAALGRHDEAAAHFERALAIEGRVEGHALLVRTRYWQARFLADRNGPGDREVARSIQGSVLEEASTIGMRGLADRAREALAQ